ncbi:UNVERIFIED_CONTAM: hypothetical protein NCL1_40316 [Trichonephila clavipes]
MDSWQTCHELEPSAAKTLRVEEDKYRSNLWYHEGHIHVRCYFGELHFPKCIFESHSSHTPEVMIVKRVYASPFVPRVADHSVVKHYPFNGIPRPKPKIPEVTDNRTFMEKKTKLKENSGGN